MTISIELRPYHPSDAPTLLELFRNSIRRVSAKDYSPPQIQAWASDEIDPDQWRERFAGRFVLIAEVNQQIAGFAELEQNGHIDRFYVSADHQRIGVGRSLLLAVIEEAQRLGLARLFVEASITARPFFEAHSFTLITEQVVLCRGVELTNFRMERLLPQPKGNGG